MAEKSIIIIGAGFAGLSAGCYARMNGYKTTVFEMHDKPGGLCTGWKRKGYTADGCIHWLVGSAPNNGFHRIWRELGLVQGRTFIDPDEYQRYESAAGEFVLYAGADRLEQHMLELSPEDARPIREFCGGIRAAMKADVPVGRPSEIQTAGDKLRFATMVVPRYLPLIRWTRVSTAEFVRQFKSPLIRDGLMSAWPESFPVAFIVMTLAWMGNKAAGYPVGGSLGLAQALEGRYLGLGGEVKYRARVAKILVENGRAAGVRLVDGTEHRSDVVISGADMHATVYDWLDGKYMDDRTRWPFEHLEPFPSMVFVALGVNRTFPELPASVTGTRIALGEPIRIGTRERTTLGFHAYNQDPTLAPAGKTLVQSMFLADRDWWVELARDRARYDATKNEIADRVIAALDRRFPGFAGQVEMRDVATPLTFERYTGNWKGSYEGWLATPATWNATVKKTLPGLGSFFMCGQWLAPGGGLPPSAQSGRDVVQILCHADRKPFVTTEP